MVKMIIVVNARFLLNEYDDHKLIILAFTNHHVALSLSYKQYWVANY